MKILKSPELWEAVKNEEHASHESDLYIPVNEKNRELVKSYLYKGNVTTFTSQIDGKLWYDIPFAYQPFWDARRGK